MKTLRKYWLQLLLSVLVLLFFIGYAADYWKPRFVQQFELFLYDTRLSLTMPSKHEKRLVIVDIDEKSLAKLGRWPWPRNVVSDLVVQLSDHYKTAAIGFDVVFAEKDDSSGLSVLRKLAQKELKDHPEFVSKLPELEQQLDYDAQMAHTIQSRAIVLGYYFNTDGKGDEAGMLPEAVLPAGIFKGKDVSPRLATGFGSNLVELMKGARSAGYFSMVPDTDGVVRRVPLIFEYKNKYYESLSLAMVRTYLGQPEISPIYPEPFLGKQYTHAEWLKIGPLKVPVDEAFQTYVPYIGKQKSFQYVSAIDVIEKKVPFETMAGRLVLIGTTAPGLKDLRVAPIDSAYPGVEVHANLILGMLDQSIPQQPKYLLAAEVLQILIVGTVLIAVLLFMNPLPSTVITFLLLTLVTAINFAIWKYGNMAMPLGTTLAAGLLLYAISMAYGYFFEARNKKQMTSLFGQYVPPELVEKMSEEPEKYSMASQSRELTVLFSDVRSFTTISESMDPKELGSYMNEFLTALSDVIRTKYLGTIDKYMGDCVMAFWGAPIQDPDHAKNAVLAGLEMHKEINALNPKLKAKGWPELHIGVGVNTGRMTVGDMGSQIRKAYTVMGDAVNLASRLEGITKQYGVGMIVGELTKQAVPEGITFRELDCVRVKGKEEPVTIYEPVGKTEELDKAIKKEVEIFHQILKMYRAQDWDMAELQLLNIKKQNESFKLYDVYLERIAHFRKNPPPADWDGVFEFQTK